MQNINQLKRTVASPERRNTDAADRHHAQMADGLIWGALLFNWLLAFVNARGVNISQGVVIFFELSLMTAAVFLVFRRGIARDQLLIFCIYAICVTFALLRFVVMQEIDLKPLRDLAIIFVFLSLGLSLPGSPHRMVMSATLVVMVVGLFEAMMPDLYGALFNAKSYYINSRGFSASQFWNNDSNFFVSGTRPTSRYFAAFTQWPRASSVFLEPVSLGNFTVVSLLVLLTSWCKVLPVARILWILSLVMLLVLSDSRFAAGCSIALLVATPVLRRWPQELSFLLFGSVVMAAGIIVMVKHVNVASDDVLGRLFYSMNAMRHLDMADILGMQYASASHYMDSGIAYFIISQSLPVVVLLPILYSIGLRMRTTEAKLYKHYLIIMFALNLMISNSLFSIKVAALVWFYAGALAARKLPYGHLERRWSTAYEA